jgi:hypothetical protein
MMERPAGKIAVVAAALTLLCWPARGWAETCSLKYEPDRSATIHDRSVENSVRCD